MLRNSSEISLKDKYSRQQQTAPFKPITNYNNGKQLQGEEYWGDLWDIIQQYRDHPESKLDGDEGRLERKHLVIDGVERISKEVLDLEIQFLQLSTPKTYLTEQQRRERILRTTEAEAADKGVQESIFYKIKNSIRQGKKINWKRKNIRKLLSS